QPSQLVVRIVNGEPVVEPLGRDRTRAFRHAVDGRERSSGEGIATETGRGDSERESEDEDEHELAQLLSHRGLGSGDLYGDQRPANLRPGAEDSKPGCGRGAQRGYAGIRAGFQPEASRDGQPFGEGRTIQEGAGLVPHLQPGTLSVTRVALE